MAKFESYGLEDIMKKFQNREKDIETVVTDMLLASAPVIVKTYKQSCTRHGHIETGTMIRNIKATQIKKTRQGSSYIEVYPQGVDKRKYVKGKRRNLSNAEKALILNHGRKGHPGSKWITEAKELCRDGVRAAYTKILEGHLKNE